MRVQHDLTTDLCHAEVADLLAEPEDLQRQPGDALLVSLLGDVTSAQIGTLMERFAAMDLASRRDVLQELTIMSGILWPSWHSWRVGWPGVKILGDMTQLSTTYHHYEDSLDLARTALYILPRHDSALVRTELLGLESRAHAHLGNQAAATRTAEACVEIWHEAQGEAAPDWLHYIDQAEVDCLAAMPTPS